MQEVIAGQYSSHTSLGVLFFMLRIFTWKALLQFLLPEIISNCPLFVRIRSKVHIQTWLKLTFDKKGERENTSYSLP